MQLRRRNSLYFLVLRRRPVYQKSDGPVRKYKVSNVAWYLSLEIAGGATRGTVSQNTNLPQGLGGRSLRVYDSGIGRRFLERKVRELACCCVLLRGGCGVWSEARALTRFEVWALWRARAAAAGGNGEAKQSKQPRTSKKSGWVGFASRRFVTALLSHQNREGIDQVQTARAEVMSRTTKVSRLCRPRACWISVQDCRTCKRKTG